MVRVKLDPDKDMVGLAKAAGQEDLDSLSYVDGYFCVEGVSQEDLDKALESFDFEAARKAALCNFISARRYTEETSGISFSGMPLATDRGSQGLINGAALSAYTDATYTCRWKTGAGFVTLDATTLKAVAKAVRDHVQACFDREAELLYAVSSGTYTETMLNEGWPS